MNDLAAQVNQRELLRVLSDFALLLVKPYAIGDALHVLVEGVVEVLDIAGAGVSIDREGRITFVAATPELVSVLERAQEAGQAGPCVQAHRTGEIVLVEDLAEHSDQWPVVTRAASEAGIVAVAGIPMHLNASHLGVLNLYDVKRRDWNEDEIRVAVVLSSMATAYVANAARLHETEQTAEQLQEALDSRVVIEQAKGILAGERQITVDRAFDLLRAHARCHQSSLRSVAEGVVNLGLRL